ncbi:hypothetical protein AVEN_194549-1 [Araneus ventricosus]|uniref:Uncharacterized protein n=1 Tax=Araneus ventricosus TaxID=182803 RepID=A0A4Y2A6C0_ARAVE|nr:hypothetical protein AVEN_194549-1 [Araneus ventricosus]
MVVHKGSKSTLVHSHCLSRISGRSAYSFSAQLHSKPALGAPPRSVNHTRRHDVYARLQPSITTTRPNRKQLSLLYPSHQHAFSSFSLAAHFLSQSQDFSLA